MNQQLVTVIMGQDCDRFIHMCLESVKGSDAIIYCDGGSKPEFLQDLFCKYGYIGGDIEPKVKYSGITLIENKYNQEDPAMNGKQRNFYLNYIKEVYPDYWCLVLDADEVVDDIERVKSFIQSAKEGVYSIHMRHFHNDLGHEDSTVEKHFVPNRLFKISKGLFYPEVEHPVLSGDQGTSVAATDVTTIWHLAHINHCFNIKGRYEKNLKHSNMHSPQFLEDWKDAHVLGRYPNKVVNILDIPEVILKNFNIDKDKYYFYNRGLETKHFIMAHQWMNYFDDDEYICDVIEFGSGRAPYGYAIESYNYDYVGVELSEYAVKNSFVKWNYQGDITTFKHKNAGKFKLVIACDILEHLNDEQLDKALKNLHEHSSQYFLFSIPFIGDPNLTNDKTHKQFKTKEEWIKLIEGYGIKIEETPSTFLFKEQILIGRKI